MLDMGPDEIEGISQKREEERRGNVLALTPEAAWSIPYERLWPLVLSQCRAPDPM